MCWRVKRDGLCVKCDISCATHLAHSGVQLSVPAYVLKLLP